VCVRVVCVCVCVCVWSVALVCVCVFLCVCTMQHSLSDRRPEKSMQILYVLTGVQTVWKLCQDRREAIYNVYYASDICVKV